MIGAMFKVTALLLLRLSTGDVATGGGNVANGVVNTGANVANGATNAVGNVANGATNAVGNVANGVTNTGANLVTGTGNAAKGILGLGTSAPTVRGPPIFPTEPPSGSSESDTSSGSWDSG